MADAVLWRRWGWRRFDIEFVFAFLAMFQRYWSVNIVVTGVRRVGWLGATPFVGKRSDQMAGFQECASLRYNLTLSLGIDPGTAKVRRFRFGV